MDAHRKFREQGNHLEQGRFDKPTIEGGTEFSRKNYHQMSFVPRTISEWNNLRGTMQAK